MKIIYPVNKVKEDALYRLIDEYSIFYFRFLAGNKPGNSWLHLANTQAYKTWLGYAFENLCFKHVLPIKKALGISGIISNEYSWVEKGTKTAKGTQIDFIIDRSDNCMNILELKYCDTVFEVTKNYAEQLREKAGIFKTKNKVKKNIFVTMLTANGVKKNEYYLSAVTNELLLEDLFME